MKTYTHTHTHTKDYKHSYMTKRCNDLSYQQEELSRQQQSTKQSRKEHMYKRQNVHEINSSRSDICNTEHNITSIQQNYSRDRNTLEHLPQREETPVTIKQSFYNKEKKEPNKSCMWAAWVHFPLPSPP